VVSNFGLYHEEWAISESNELTGRAYLIKGGELTDNEKLKIHTIENEVYYTADVSHNPEPVSFKLTECSDTIFIFENLLHDFPKKITYEKINRVRFFYLSISFFFMRSIYTRDSLWAKSSNLEIR